MAGLTTGLEPVIVNKGVTIPFHMYVCAPPAFSIALLFSNAPTKIISGQVWAPFACTATLAIAGTLIAWMLFYKLVQRTDALFAASVTYLIPIVAISWGLLDGEVLSIIQVGGMLLILTGVYFTTASPKSEK